MDSRIERTRRQRQKNQSKKKWKKRVMAGIGSSILAVGISSGVVYASQSNSSASLSEWFYRQVEVSKGNIQLAILQEATSQAERLQTELDKSKKQAASDLGKFTNLEIKSHIKAIQAHADSLIVNAKHFDDKSSYQKRLQLIVQNSIAQMNAVMLQGPAASFPVDSPRIPAAIPSPIPNISPIPELAPVPAPLPSPVRTPALLPSPDPASTTPGSSKPLSEAVEHPTASVIDAIYRKK